MTTRSIRNAPVAPRRGRPRGGFTMVELLMVITIIALLAGIVLGGLRSARQSARTSRTKATIAKLNQIVMQRYESYMTRRVPLVVAGSNAPFVFPAGMQPQVMARLRLAGLRELMRLEMPDRWNDVLDEPAQWPVTLPNGAPVTLQVPRPVVSHLYLAQYQQAIGRAGNQLVGENSHAECLYLLVMTGDPEAREQFSATEIGDTDGDGLMEFIDGWGNPIYFLRWAPAFTIARGAPTQIQSGDPVTDHDPFDPMRIEPNAFKLVPLIYSGGSDGQYKPAGGGNAWNFDINTGQNLHARDFPNGYDEVGAPADQHGDGMNWKDNITNHWMEQR